MVEGIILAGGKASRMKQNKMLLEYKNHPLIFHSVRTMKQICNNVTIVTGYYKEDYLPYFGKMRNIKIVHNSNHENGMFSSVLKGVSEVKNDFFLIPGDCPLVKVETYQKLLDSTGKISVPIYQGRKGHPILIRKELISSLKTEDISSNLKIFRDRYEVTYIEVNDPGVIYDVDNKSDYQKLNKFERNDGSED